MAHNQVGRSAQRLDAVAKVTGQAKYTEDFFERDMLVGKVLRSPHAHAVVRRIDAARARALPGVVAVIVPGDLPPIRFGTAGHPWTLDVSHQDVADRLILTDKARFVGDAVAAVVAVDALTAAAALRLLEVDYEVLPHVLTAEAALAEGAPALHPAHPGNVLGSTTFRIGDFEAESRDADHIFEGEFETAVVQHCHLESMSAFAFVDTDGRIVVNSSTQIPHIVRRVVAQALGLPWGRVKVIKPFIGGGFGNKQDVVIEPMAAAMTLAAGGRPVRYTMTREEVFVDTRTRHGMKVQLRTAVTRDGILKGIHVRMLANTGAYASHGHVIALSAGSKFRPLYDFRAITCEARTVYTNLPVAGAMRGYGAPQIFFALESHLDDIARALGMSPADLRRRNLIKVGHTDPLSLNVVCSFGIPECIERGLELIQWEARRRAHAGQQGPRRRGLGMALFAYVSGTHPDGQELAGARIVMNQDGSVTLQVGATEIGQGSDTVLAQMAAEILDLPMAMVHLVTSQDTDITPYDPGSYASRQTFVCGQAVRKAALEVRDKVLAVAARQAGLPASELVLRDRMILERTLERPVCSLEDVAMASFYDRLLAAPITSDTSANVRSNAESYGATFVEVEVDIPTGKVEVLEIWNVHDSGTIINPRLAEGQVHGGVSMALGAALLEQMLFDPRTGKTLNNNLLDYKLPTLLDTPRINAAFVETWEAAGSFGAKSLGECPAISPAPAVRNAVLDATGVAFNRIPLYPQVVFEKFRETGLLAETSLEHV